MVVCFQQYVVQDKWFKMRYTSEILDVSEDVRFGKVDKSLIAIRDTYNLYNSLGQLVAFSELEVRKKLLLRWFKN